MSFRDVHDGETQGKEASRLAVYQVAHLDSKQEVFSAHPDQDQMVSSMAGLAGVCTMRNRHLWLLPGRQNYNNGDRTIKATQKLSSLRIISALCFISSFCSISSSSFFSLCKDKQGKSFNAINYIKFSKKKVGGTYF